MVDFMYFIMLQRKAKGDIVIIGLGASSEQDRVLKCLRRD